MKIKFKVIFNFYVFPEKHRCNLEFILINDFTADSIRETWKYRILKFN